MATSPLETCPVCLTSLANRNRKRKNELGRPECCDHMFCLSCIQEWSKNVNTCPVDRLKFNRIDVFTSLIGSPIRRVDIHDVSLGDPMNEDYTYCEICHRCNREESLLLCDGCDKGFHLDCLFPPLTEVPEGDWYCSACEIIVQAQYDVSMSSPDEKSTYEPPYLALRLTDHSDTSSMTTIVSEEEEEEEEESESELSDSSNIDVTGSDSDINVKSSNNKFGINFGQDFNSDYLDSDGSFLALSTSKSKLTNLVKPAENGLQGAGKHLVEKRRSVKSEGSSSAIHLLPSLSSDGEGRNQCASDEEDKISHKPKARAPDDFIVISSSEDDDSVSVCRKVPVKKKKALALSESEESKATIDVENSDSEVNVEATPSPVPLTPEDINQLEAGPSSSSTPATYRQSVNQKRASGGGGSFSKSARMSAKKNRSNILRKAQNKRKRSRKRNSRRRSKRRRLKPVNRPASGASLEGLSNNSSLQRARARTAATHTPRVSAMRQAVQESYRHQDKSEGLEYARYILVNARQSPRGKSRLLENVPSTSSISSASSPARADQQKIKLLGENKSITSEDDSTFQHDAQKPINRMYGFVSNRLEPFHPSNASPAKPKAPLQRRHSVSDTFNSQPLSLEDRRKAEIQRRMVSNNSTSSATSPTKSKTADYAKKRRTNSVSSQVVASSNLVDMLCKNLDDLENKCEVKKDGTVVPIRLQESEPSTELKVRDQSQRLVHDDQAKMIDVTSYHHRNALGEDDMDKQKGKTAKTNSHFNAHRKSSHSSRSKHLGSRIVKPEGDEQPKDAVRSGISAKGGLAGYKIPKLKINQFLYEDDYQHFSVKQERKSSCPDIPPLPLPDPKLLDGASTSHNSQQSQVGNGGVRGDFGERVKNYNHNHGLKERKEQQDEAVLEPRARPETMDATHATMTPRELVKKALDVYFDKKRIKNREYRRILERATLKIEKNPTEIPRESRVKKLVAGYVDAYRKAKLGY